MRKSFAFVLVLLGCGGGSSEVGHEATEESSGGESVDLSPDALVAQYDQNARRLARRGAGTPLSEHAGDALSAIRDWATENGHDEVYATMEIVSDDWSLMRHRVSGEVTGRSIGGITLARFPDGRCFEYGGSFFQEYVGGEFDTTIRAQGVGGGFVVPCETIDAVAAREGVAQ